jgi:hypothetical protein
MAAVSASNLAARGSVAAAAFFDAAFLGFSILCSFFIF